MTAPGHLRTCPVPDCRIILRAWQHLCKDHWLKLPHGIRDEILDLARAGDAELDEVVQRAVTWLGDHQQQPAPVSVEQAMAPPVAQRPVDWNSYRPARPADSGRHAWKNRRRR